MATPARKKVLVIGAGMAGAKAAKLLAAGGKFEVVTVEPKDFLEIPYASVRAVVDPKTAERSLFPLTEIAGGIGQIVQGSVKAVKKNSVVLESGEELTFDYLILASGAIHTGKGVITPGVTGLAERKKELQNIAEKIKNAKSVAVVGGGPVGIEVVGEIVNAYAGKKVTLIHSGATLLEGKPPKMVGHLMALLKQFKVEVLLSDRADVVDEASGTLTTKSGKTVAAEVVFWAAGAKPNSAALAEGGELASSLDAAGRCKVDEFLRLQGAPHIFVLGDVNNTPQAKLGYLADLQAVLTAGNLQKIASGSTALAKWAPPLEPKGAMMVTFGPSDGSCHVGSCVCTGSIVAMVKSKHLFVDKVRGDYGIKK